MQNDPLVGRSRSPDFTRNDFLGAHQMESDNRPRIGILAERFAGERRVAFVPADVHRLATRAVFTVEAGAGAAAGYSDEAYAAAGARLAGRLEVIGGSSVLLAVRAPDDLGAFRPLTTVISLGGRDPDVAATAAARDLKHLGLERLPRTTRAQAMDVLSSQATVSGYAAVLEGARTLDVFLPMLSTAAGNVKPAKMIALGAGVAGLQAIATARRLGAVVHGFDVREAAREQVESLGARFVSLGEALKAQEAVSGYAAAQSADEQEAIRRALAPTLAQMQLIITSAQIPGRAAPLLIDDEALAGLAEGTVIVDLAAETGGNTSRTRAGETVDADGVTIIGSIDFASRVAADASRLFSGNLRALIEHIVSEEGGLSLNPGDPITGALLGVELPLREAA